MFSQRAAYGVAAAQFCACSNLERNLAGSFRNPRDLFAGENHRAKRLCFLFSTSQLAAGAGAVRSYLVAGVGAALALSSAPAAEHLSRVCSRSFGLLCVQRYI